MVKKSQKVIFLFILNFLLFVAVTIFTLAIIKVIYIILMVDFISSNRLRDSQHGIHGI